MTNLYNFMDGSDGLAGGMAVFGFGAFAAAAALAGDASICLAALGIAAAALAFLAFNLPPARVFMGDAGSILLGFLAGALGLLGIARGLWPVWFPVLVFSPFIADASVTLIRRLFRGERIWEAHRSHYYQRLVQLGWGHRRTALVEYLLMAIVATLAVAGVGRSVAAQLAVVGVVVLLLTGSGIQVDRAWARHRIRTHAAD
jgi:UDP-N-acetylmuramyl pentapeptide phosphotransferase/UDP-N-acetylglucosamine-1-phosphate transferase